MTSLHQSIVNIERTRSYGLIACLHMGWQDDGDGGRLTAVVAATLKNLTDGVVVRHAPDQRVGDGGLQLGGAVTVEEIGQGVSNGADIVTALGSPHQQIPACRGRLCQTVGGLMPAAPALSIDKSLDMVGIFDLCPLVVTAPMGGDHVLAIDDAQRVRLRQHGQRPPHMGVRNAVIVQVEANIGRLADMD